MTTLRTSHRSSRRLAGIAPLLAAACTLASCGANPLSGGEDGFTAEEWQLVLELEPPEAPPGASPFNEYSDDPGAASFGHQLFFDKEFSSAIRVEGPSGAVGQAGMVACTTCHDPDAYFSDPRPMGGMSHGVAYTKRNSPSLVNAAYYYWLDWGGSADSLATQGAATLETASNVSSTRLFVAHTLYEKYREVYEATFGRLEPALDPSAPDAARFPPTGRPKLTPDEPDGPWEQMAEADRQAVNLIMANIGKAFEAYERRLISGGTAFGRYLRDREAADFSPAARRGLALFIGKAACNDCHRGPILSDNEFHNDAVPQAVGEHAPAIDEGRYEDVLALVQNPFNAAGRFSADPRAGAAKLASANPEDESTKGQFRTKSLLNVAVTAPYFHNGSVGTLEEAVQHYNRGGGDAGSYAGVTTQKLRPLRLTDSEVRDIVAFLQSLTGEPVPQQWREDPHASP